MSKRPEPSALDDVKSTVQLTLLDPLGRSIDGLKYQIREGSKVVARGVTDGQGRVRSFASTIGARLTVHVERFASDELKQVKTLIPWTEDFKVKLLSGKVRETLPPKPNTGSPGAYKRKTYIAKAGETLAGIGKKHGTTAEVLARLNALKPDASIREGLVVKLPVEHERMGPSGGPAGRGPGATTGSKNSTAAPASAKGRAALPPLTTQKTEARGSNGTPKTSVDLRCDQSGCIKLGMTGPLVEEINIRLMGFGGSVTTAKPLSEFTAQTEAAVRQFQRDYMNAPETGRVCGAVLRAMDEFRLRFPVSIDRMKCPCGHCDGFGKQRRDSESVQLYKNGKIIEGIEYPGMHRALLWLFRAALFYTSVKDKELGYSLLAISSGYRCWDNNKAHGRKSTNHMGNALDLQFKKGTSSTRCTGQHLETLREKIFMARLGAQMRWNERNRPALESTADGATSWVHIDVRTYGEPFKKDRYYAVTQAGVDGEPLMDTARRAGMLALVNCGGIPPRTPDQATDRKPIADLDLSSKGLDFIKGWEKFGPQPYDDSEGFCTVGYGHLLDYQSCSAMAADASSEYHKFKDGITESRASEILRSDVEKAIAEVRKYVHVPLYQQEFDALVSLSFNTGGFRKFRKLVSKINTQDYTGCCDEFADITNGGTSGLVKRRQAEMKMFRNNVYDASH